MESNEITEIRNRFKTETTLSHAWDNGHTQFYSEWLERELVQLQNTSSNSEYTKCPACGAKAKGFPVQTMYYCLNIDCQWSGHIAYSQNVN